MAKKKKEEKAKKQKAGKRGRTEAVGNGASAGRENAVLAADGRGGAAAVARGGQRLLQPRLAARLQVGVRHADVRAAGGRRFLSRWLLLRAACRRDFGSGGFGGVGGRSGAGSGSRLRRDGWFVRGCRFRELRSPFAA